MGLLEVQSKWIAKFDQMRESGIDMDQLAAPFLSIPGIPAASAQAGPILLVGKATGGDWGKDSFLSKTGVPNRIEERRDFTRKHLLWRQEEYQRTAFWRCWKRLHEISAPVIWTNLAKIGVRKRNPEKVYLSAQIDLACETLELEIEEYKPKLVVLATGDYAGDEIVCPIFKTGRGEWNEVVDGEFWWLGRTATRPAILWTGHPQGKSPTTRNKCLEKAKELMA
jgi:hypothetical protein